MDFLFKYGILVMVIMSIVIIMPVILIMVEIYLFRAPFQECTGIRVYLKFIFRLVIDNLAFVDIVAIVKLKLYCDVLVGSARNLIKGQFFCLLKSELRTAGVGLSRIVIA